MPAQRNTTAGSSKARPRLNEGVIRKLWERMTMMYGSPFTAQYGLEDDGTWAAVLGGITPEQLAHGLNACVERSMRNIKAGQRDYPPGAGEFRALCLIGFQAAPATAPEVKALPDLRTVEQRMSWARPYIQTLKAACRAPGRRVMDKLDAAVIAAGMDFTGQPATGDA